RDLVKNSFRIFDGSAYNRVAKFGETSSKILLEFLTGPPIMMLRQPTSADPPARCAMYYVYILLNEAKTRTYTGVSDNVDNRLTEHNTGRVKSSRPYRTYEIIHVEPFETLSEARQKEKFYKSATGRRKLKEILFEA
ncbi:MAG: GIY-YIG nuclease family protein, partial [Phycisphaerae bacterium]